MIDATHGPRCTSCDNVLPREGGLCHVCHADAHFEGVLRTAPRIGAAQGRSEEHGAGSPLAAS